VATKIVPASDVSENMGSGQAKSSSMSFTISLHPVWHAEAFILGMVVPVYNLSYLRYGD
jgi:hypothetical protein